MSTYTYRATEILNDPIKKDIYDTFDGPYDNLGLCISTGDSNVYVGGYTYGDLDGQTHSRSMIDESDHKDVFVTKYNDEGTHASKQWMSVFVDAMVNYEEDVEDIAYDSDGNAYVVGYKVGMELEEVYTATSRSKKVFITKRNNSDGTKAWFKYIRIGGTGSQQVRTDASNNVVCALCIPKARSEGYVRNLSLIHISEPTRPY